MPQPDTSPHYTESWQVSCSKQRSCNTMATGIGQLTKAGMALTVSVVCITCNLSMLIGPKLLAKFDTPNPDNTPKVIYGTTQ